MPMFQDIRFALRSFRRAPTFAIVAVFTLALGTGSVATVLSMANVYLWRPLPVAEPERLALLYAQREGTDRYEDFSYTDYRALRGTPGFTDLIAYYPVAASIGSATGSERVFGEMVSGNYFEHLGVHAQVGRVFTEVTDAAPGAAPALVVSERFWRDRLGGTASAIGATVLLNGHSFTVVGVAPAGFHGVYFLGFQPQYWAPAEQYQLLVPGAGAALSTPGGTTFRLMGRLAPGATVEQAGAAAEAIVGQLSADYPLANAGRHAVALAERDTRPEAGATAKGSRLLWAVLLAIAVLVVLVASANVAGLLLARAVARRREVALRLALGASRSRLILQLVTESLVLATAGGVLGIALAFGAQQILTAVLRFPTDIPFVFEFPFDLRVFGYTALTTLGGALVFGLIPALQTADPVLTNGLKDGGGVGRRSRLRSALVIGQLAVTCLLLVATGLALRSLAELRQVQLGFDTRSALLVTVNPGLIGRDAARSTAFYERLLQGGRDLPGVAGATLAGDLPLEFSARGGTFYAEGAEREEGDPGGWSAVAPGYFEAMGTRLIEGREFGTQDESASTRVAIVSQALATKLWPGTTALGRRVRLGTRDAPAVEIVGVAENVKIRTVDEAPAFQVYLPMAQDFVPAMTLLLRTDMDPLTLVPAVRALVKAVDADVPIADFKTLEGLLEGRAFAIQRLSAGMTGALGAIALCLAVVGLYGLVAYTVSQRRREFGIRLAIGATGPDLERLVVSGGLRLAGAGIGLGLVAAVAVTWLARGLLYGVSPSDPLVLGSIAALLAMVMALASWLPARRAAALDPVTALRSE